MADADPNGFEPVVSKLDLDLFAARWVTKDVELHELEPFATQALTQGYESHALGELSWPHDSWDEVEGLFERFMADIGRPLPTETEAYRLIRRDLARRTIAGELPLISGARRICSLRFETSELDVEDLYWLLDDWESRADAAGIEADMMAFLQAWANDRPVPPTSRSGLGMAPSLGGSRAQDEPNEDPKAEPNEQATPEPEAPADDGTLRFSFNLNLNFDWGRTFNWSWSSDERRD